MKIGINRDMVEELARMRGLDPDSVSTAVARALVAAYKRRPGAPEEARVLLDLDGGELRIFGQELDDDGNVLDEWEDTEISPEELGRIAAQTFKQVMSQGIREAVRDQVFEIYEGREGDLVTGIVQQVDHRFTVVDLGDAEALMPGSERIPFERLERGNRIKALILEVRNEAKGPQIIVSRSHPDFVRRLLELEVPELVDGTIEIRAIAREPGHRTKIAVSSNDSNVDPKGACVGARGSRVRQIVNELRGEKVDVVQFSEDTARLIAEALGPAKVIEVRLDEEEKVAVVIVNEHQLSLAIGKEGQNARLAARLTGYRVDIRSDVEDRGETPTPRETETPDDTAGITDETSDAAAPAEAGADGDAAASAEPDADVDVEVEVAVASINAAASADAVAEANADADADGAADAEPDAGADSAVDAEPDADTDADPAASVDADGDGEEE